MKEQKKASVDLTKGIKRPDAVTYYKAVEIGQSGYLSDIRQAVERLKESDKPQKVLVVPARSMNTARKILKEIGVSATIRNIAGTRREYVSSIITPVRINTNEQ
jgi:hypothetical protein